MRQKLKVNKYTVFHDHARTCDVIYVAELVDVLDNGDLRFWHLYDASQDPKRYQAKVPLAKWRAAHEWVEEKTGRRVAAPTEEEKKKLRRFITTVSPDEITIIVPAFDGLLTVGGKFREPLTNKVDNWIREQKLTPKQRLRVLSNPSAGEMIAMVEDPYSRDFRVGVVDAEEEDYLAAMVDLRPLNALLSRDTCIMPELADPSDSSDESEDEPSDSSCSSGGSTSERSSSSNHSESTPRRARRLSE